MPVDRSQVKRVKLQECATFQEGYVNPSQGVEEYFGSEVKWLRAVDLNDSFVWETSRRLSKKGYESAGKASLLFEPDTLAISKSGTIGRLGILKDYMCGNRAVINIRTDRTRFDTRFIFYSLLIRRREIESRAVGSVQPNLYCSALGDIEIEAPPLAEQKAIAGVLGALDDKIELNRRMNATLEAMARALFQSWFVDFDPVRAKLDGRHPPNLDPATAKLFPDTFEDSQLGKIPFGWTTSDIGAFAINHDANREPVKESDRKRGPYPYFGASGVVDYVDGYIFDGEYLLVAEDGENLRTRKTPVAFRAIDKFWVNNHAHVITGPTLGGTRFLLLTLGRAEIGGYLTGSTIPKLSQQSMNRIPFVLPPRELLDEFERVTHPIFRIIDDSRRSSETLATLRDSLLPKLLSGELRVPDAEQFVEEAL